MTTTQRYHVSAKGKGVCEAQPGNCPVTLDGEKAPHFESEGEAEAFFARHMEEKEGVMKTLTKEGPRPILIGGDGEAVQDKVSGATGPFAVPQVKVESAMEYSPEETCADAAYNNRLKAFANKKCQERYGFGSNLADVVPIDDYTQVLVKGGVGDRSYLFKTNDGDVFYSYETDRDGNLKEGSQMAYSGGRSDDGLFHGVPAPGHRNPQAMAKEIFDKKMAAVEEGRAWRERHPWKARYLTMRLGMRSFFSKVFISIAANAKAENNRNDLIGQLSRQTSALEEKRMTREYDALANSLRLKIGASGLQSWKQVAAEANRISLTKDTSGKYHVERRG